VDIIPNRSDVPAQVRRRAAAAALLPPLPCGHRDPISCAGHARPLDDREVGAWVQAIEHLASLDLHGIVPAEVRANAEFRHLVVAQAAVA
jgi:hypothetical protein